MAGVQESLEPTVSETESIIQEYRERIRQALEVDSNKLRERAERDGSQIIASAKEEADRAIAQARQEARVESERIIAAANEEAEKIARRSREEAAEARQESARIISETREKASQIITEVIERGTTQAQSEFARVASETISRTSRLLNQVNKSVEQIIGETEKNIKAELERLANVFAEAESKLQPLSEINDKEAEVNSQQATVEAVRPAPAVREKTEPATPSVGDKRGAPIRESDDIRLFKGSLKLEMVPPFNQERLEGPPEWLARLPGLKVVSTGGYAGANKWITTYNIELEQPVPLLKIIKTIPRVKDVTEHKGNIAITLK